MSRFIVIEGIDGAGKTTLVKGLINLLQEKGVSVTGTREPGGTPKAEAIRERLFSEAGKTLSVAEQMALVHEGRLDHVRNLIVPNLQKNNIIISDRFELSSIVYQVWYEKDDLESTYEKYESEIKALLGEYVPEYVCLTLPAELVRKRQLQSNELNVFDAVDIEAINDRIAAYEYGIRRVYGKLHVVDASDTPEKVLQAVASVLKIDAV